MTQLQYVSGIPHGIQQSEERLLGDSLTPVKRRPAYQAESVRIPVRELPYETECGSDERIDGLRTTRAKQAGFGFTIQELVPEAIVSFPE